jgi:hypothetical protein
MLKMKDLILEGRKIQESFKKNVGENINEATPPGNFDKKYIVALSKDVENIIISYKDKRRSIKDYKGKKALLNSMFSEQVAKKLAEKHLIGKTPKQFFWNLLGGVTDDNIPIKKIISADFSYSPPGAIQDELYLSTEVEYEDGESGPLTFTPVDFVFSIRLPKR